MDVIVQLAICFICLTMGSDKQLRKFVMTLDVTIPGAPRLIWTRKESVISETIAFDSENQESRQLSHGSINSELELL